MLLYEVDFFAFMGQSNMAGRGIAEQAPSVPQGHGYEFRAITDPSTLHPITEPFGKDENLLSGIYEPGMKTGSLISAFVNSCYQQTGVPIVGVSASKGGSSIAEWAPGSSFYSDAASRTRQCLIWLQNHHINVRHRSMVWCQGCTDGDLHTDPDRQSPGSSSALCSDSGNAGEACQRRSGCHSRKPVLRLFCRKGPDEGHLPLSSGGLQSCRRGSRNQYR